MTKKIKLVKTEFKKQGKFIENSVPYGYKKDENNKYQLIIDSEAANVNEALACLRLMARGGEAALPLALAVLLSAGGLWYLVSHGKQA